MNVFSCLIIALAIFLQIALNNAESVNCDEYLGDGCSAVQCTDITDELGCGGDQCLETCKDCITGIDWDDYAGGQNQHCQCHNNGCDQCHDGWWKLNFDFPCQDCLASFPNCKHCSDFLGCQQCEQGYVLYEHPTCGDDSLLFDPDNTPPLHFCVPSQPDDPIECEFGIELPEEPPVDCFTCAEKCTDLTDELGCAGDQCLDTCRNCISGIDWDDYEGGQNNDCECHNNGCDQCEDGWFKVDFDFPCQSCDDFVGCLHCTDFLGCQQCEDGYTLVEDPDCGEDSLVNTGNAKVHYCVPDGEADCSNVGGQNPVDVGCPTGLIHESCNSDANCVFCQSWGCDQCKDGYFRPATGYHCVDCESAYGEACIKCADYQGCMTCDKDKGYDWYWNSDDDCTGPNLWGLGSCK